MSKTHDPNECVRTGGWKLHCENRSEVVLVEHAQGTIDDAIAAARKVLTDDTRDSADAQEQPEITSVAMFEHFVGGSAGWCHALAGTVTRRAVRLREGYTTSQKWPRLS